MRGEGEEGEEGEARERVRGEAVEGRGAGRGVRARAGLALGREEGARGEEGDGAEGEAVRLELRETRAGVSA